jgi:hypothetical protein
MAECGRDDPSVMDVKMNAAEALKFVVPNKMLKATGRDRITLVACSAFPLEQSIPAL